MPQRCSRLRYRRVTPAAGTGHAVTPDGGTRDPGPCRGRRGSATKKGRIAAAFPEQRTRRRRASPQRWRALKRGLLLQITKTLPRRRTTLQSRWRAFADFREDRTFMTYLKGRLGRASPPF